MGEAAAMRTVSTRRVDLHTRTPGQQAGVRADTSKHQLGPDTSEHRTPGQQAGVSSGVCMVRREQGRGSDDAHGQHTSRVALTCTPGQQAGVMARQAHGREEGNKGEAAMMSTSRTRRTHKPQQPQVGSLRLVRSRV
jgi:hypothetical protein